MKKIICLLLGIFIFYVFISNSLARSLTIPDDAIRIRIIPNSNSSFDQDIKKKVKDKIEITMYDLLKDAKSSKEAYDIIENNLELVDKDVQKVLNFENYDKGYNVNFGKNYFPQKEYKGVKYEEGYYESLLITLGKGEGDNWWCVLFPPLCLIEGEENDSVEYKSIVMEILNKYLP
ncbi:MAG: stage II sporulation protein R [Bacilli bacterium]|nr:stage II sporulation protein R [Bacilli bacterium]